MSDVAVIERPDVEVTETSWQPTGEMSFEEWCEAGAKLGQITEAVQWWIGDWINYGAVAYGHKYEDALEATGYEYQSLRNMATIAGQFELSRRRDNLSWSHHDAVAGLESEEEQDRFLDLAVAEKWTREVLRGQVREGQDESPGNGKRPASKGPVLTLKLTFEQTFENEALRRRTAQTLREHAEALGFTEK